MDQYYKDYYKKLKGRIRFNSNFRFQHLYAHNQKNRVALSYFAEAAEKVDWQVVSISETSLELTKPVKWYNQETYSITIQEYSYSQLEISFVKRSAFDYRFTDKQIQLLIHAYEIHIKGFRHEDFLKRDQEIEAAYQWTHYVVPDELPSEPEPEKKLSLLVSYILVILSQIPIVFISIGTIVWDVIVIGEFLFFLYFIIGSQIVLLKFVYRIPYRKMFFLSYLVPSIGIVFFVIPIFYTYTFVKDVDIVAWCFTSGIFSVMAYFVTMIVKSRLDFTWELIDSYKIPGEVYDFIYFHHTIKKMPRTAVEHKLKQLGWKNPELLEIAFHHVATGRVPYYKN